MRDPWILAFPFVGALAAAKLAWTGDGEFQILWGYVWLGINSGLFFNMLLKREGS